MLILYFEKHITRKSLLLLTLFMLMSLVGLAQLKADFTSSVTGGCSPLFVQFEDRSTGNPDEWSWDLGDGGAPITQQNPGIIYINPGSYTIRLKVKNVNGEDSITRVAYINVYAKPKVEFSASPTSGCFPLMVNFTDQTDPGSGTIKSWLWDFGDGLGSSSQNPAHLYNLTDTFSVTLKVTNSFGCSHSISKASYISVADTVQSDFNFSVTNVCTIPTAVSFANLSNSAVPLNYQWTFGDGASSTILSPSHTYTQGGAYNVMLIASNSDGCSDTMMKPLIIGTPKADFSLPLSACVGQSVILKDSSNPSPAVSGIWDFGDGIFGNGLSVTHVYAKAGIYSINYRATFGGCSNSIKKNIEVVDIPVASFTSASILGKCTAPLAVQFANTSSFAGSWLWDFGDGTTSTDANPAHTYSIDGNYTVTLTAFSAKGSCSNTISMPGFVRIGQPVINGILNTPFKGCVNSSVSFVGIINSPEQVVSYNWNLGDGTSSNSATPVHVYNAPGVYDVSLVISTASGCTDSFSMNEAVFINERPKVNFTANPIDACASSEVQFFDQTPGTNDFWIWKFGDGTVSNDQNPSHHYYDTGYFSVVLYVYNGGCSDSLLMTDFIHVRPPVAKFQPVSNCSQRFQRTFTDLSVGALKWTWDFGDGKTDTVTSPVHLYADTGRYNVTLIVSNETCADTLTLPVSIIKESPSFTIKAINSNYCEHDSVKFVANGYNLPNISGFKWGFGDGGQTSYNLRDTVIYYKYDSSGTYEPLLYTRDKNNCVDSVTLSHTVSIYGPSAAFSNLEGICRGKDFIFQDESKADGLHPILNWFWDYGDGASENLTSGPFKHFYTDTGTYNVKLIVSDNNGCADTLFKPGAVIIAAPLADFTLFDSVKCTQNTINLVNNSVGIDLNYAWDFGDGNTSTIQDPSYTYSREGIYSIRLKVEDRFGCSDSLFKQDVITISNPVASFTISDSTATCPPLEVNTKNYSKNYQSILWNFGDGNTSTLFEPTRLYLIPGNYNFRLIAHGFGSCYDTATRLITIKGPNGTLKYTPDQACYPAKVSFSATTQNAASFIWDFGDGGTQFGASNTTSYNYAEPGTYVPKLILKDNSGCQVAIVHTDTIKISGVMPKIIPVTSIGCDSSMVVFTDSSTFSAFDPMKIRVLDFGDGFSSSETNPVHYYKKSGTYDVVLNIQTGLGCTGTYTTPVTVNVKQAPVIVSVIPDSACLNTSLNFYANETTNIPYDLQWHWDFGNNNGSSDQNTVYSYSIPGTYAISLSLDAANGCNDHEQKNLVILPNPNTDAGQSTSICLSNAVTLQPSGAVSYVWDPSASLSCSRCANPVARPVVNTTYYVNGSDDFGCVQRDSLQMQVIQPVKVSLNTKSDTVCAGSSILLIATGAEKYQWLPASGLSNPNIANPVATPVGTTVYSVIGSDSKSCFNDTATVTVLVAPIPKFDIADSVITAGAGSTYVIKTQNSPDIVSWIWQPAYNLSCTNCAQPTTILKTNVTYSAQAINSFGCISSDNIRFEVTCNNSNVFIPNTFSPNNDSRNDYFYPQGKGLFTIKSMKIFNRWGVMVYAKSNFTANAASEGWDGKYGGSDQPTGVYVYMIDVLCDNGVVLTYKGDVTLIR